MDTTISKRESNTDCLLSVFAIAIIFASTLIGSLRLQTSKIEEGTIVQKSDSVTTVVIPDKR